jgi:cyclohexanone monooxygenase
LDPAKESSHKAHYPERRRAAFDTPFGIAGYPPPVKSALDATEEERLRAYEAKWAEGGSINFLYSFTDLLINKGSNDTASEFVRRKIRATVKDPKTAELLCPNDHPIGTKRLILDTDYYETYNRDNVTRRASGVSSIMLREEAGPSRSRMVRLRHSAPCPPPFHRS